MNPRTHWPRASSWEKLLVPGKSRVGFSKSKRGNHITPSAGWGFFSLFLQCNLWSWKKSHKSFLQKNQTICTHQDSLSAGNEGPFGCVTLYQKEWEAICLQAVVASKWRGCYMRATWPFLSHFCGVKEKSSHTLPWAQKMSPGYHFDIL